MPEHPCRVRDCDLIPGAARQSDASFEQVARASEFSLSVQHRRCSKQRARFSRWRQSGQAQDLLIPPESFRGMPPNQPEEQ
jgi:hypothetical protein